MNIDDGNKSDGWPPTYDFEQLAVQIKQLSGFQNIRSNFYHFYSSFDSYFQGDVINFDAQVPIIDADGDITMFEGDYNQWLILGNTCDLDRDLANTKYSHISPLIPLSPDAPQNILDGLQTYNSFRKFYIPHWESGSSPGYCIDFGLICTVDKTALFNYAKVITRMKQVSWLLLHCCLVRYLARDDGRETN